MTTVVIWNNHVVPLGNSWAGHASVSIDDDWGSETSYVSWLPGEDHKIMRQYAGPGANISTDLMFEKYAPDHIIRLTNMDTGAMQGKWNQIRHKEGAHYRYLRKNCSTIASRVLKEGSRLGGMKRHHIVWTPLMVKRLAFEMGGTIMKWTELLEECRRCGHLTEGDVKVLMHLHKRDERSGSSMDTFHYSKGRSVQTKTGLLWGERKHNLNVGDNKLCYVSDGTLISAKTTTVVNGFAELHDR